MPPQPDTRVDRQQNYQHFHIGIYVSVATAIIGASFFINDKLPPVGKLLLTSALLLLLGAGMCGGMVAAKLPSASTFEAFASERIGFSLPWSSSSWPRWRPATWEALEHLLFWFAMLALAAFGVILLAAS